MWNCSFRAKTLLISISMVCVLIEHDNWMNKWYNDEMDFIKIPTRSGQHHEILFDINSLSWLSRQLYNSTIIIMIYCKIDQINSCMDFLSIVDSRYWLLIGYIITIQKEKKMFIDIKAIIFLCITNVSQKNHYQFDTISDLFEQNSFFCLKSFS